MKKKYFLNETDIAKFLTSLKDELAHFNFSKDNQTIYSIAVEELLLSCLENKKGNEFTYTSKLKNGLVTLTIKISGEAFDPLAETGKVFERMTGKMTIPPKYSYDGENTVIFSLRTHNTFANSLKNSWVYLKPQKKSLIKALILQAWGFFLATMAPLYSSRFVSSINSGDMFGLVLTGVLVFLVDILGSWATYFMKRQYNNISQNVLNKMERDMLEEAVRIKAPVIEKKGTGTFIQRLTTDTTLMADSLIGIVDKGSLLINSMGILIAVLHVNPLVFVYMLISQIILFFVESYRNKVSTRKNKILRRVNDDFFSMVGEVMHGSKDVKLLNCEDSMIKRIVNVITASNITRSEQNEKNDRFLIIRRSVQHILDLGFVLILFYTIKREMIVPSVALVLYNYNVGISGSALRIGNFLDTLRSFIVSNERIFDIKNEYEFPKETFGSKSFDKPFSGSIELRNVTFAYNHNDLLDRDITVLKDVSFKINPGEKVAFVGGSGCGKTTIFNMISGLYKPDDGTVLYDGIDIRELTRSALRDSLVVISQNPYLFNMSIRDNMLLVKADATDEEIREACKKACIDEDINGFEHGYDTLIGEGGINLSGGQRQRLAIARGLLKGCNAVLLDEATSALDNMTQKKVQEAIYSLDNRMTVVMIAHRLSTVINADRIFFVKNGKILAGGTHRELLDQCSEYKALYQMETEA